MSEKLCVLTEQEVLEEQFTIYGTFDRPLFLAKDVAAVIEHSSITMMLKNVDEDEKVKIRPKESLGLLTSNNEYWFLTEDGLYEVLMQSRKPIAKDNNWTLIRIPFTEYDNIEQILAEYIEQEQVI